VYKGDQPIQVESGDCARTPLQQLVAEIWRVIGDGGVVMLGEIHDNAEHHRVRADMLWPRLSGIAPSARPAVVFEHIHVGQQNTIDNFYRAAPRARALRAVALLDGLGWNSSGWPAADIFVPLFDAVLRARLPIVAGDAPRERVRTLVRHGIDALEPQERVRIDVSGAMPQPLVEALTSRIRAVHCGYVAAASLQGMNAGQRYRDAYMTQTLVDAADRHDGAFLIAGNDHVRTDRGVPWYLRQMLPGKKTVSVVLREVEEGWNNPQDYLPRDPAGNLASDYVLFTPAHARPDYCSKMRDSMASSR
jgi:uncharacterized iron-regulated protein